MRVALFTETFLPKMDGIVRVVLRLLDHLNERGLETIIFCPKLGEVPEYYGRTRIIAIPGLTVPVYPELRMCPPSPTVYNTLKEFQPDVTHFIHPVTVGIPGLVMAKQLGIPTLASFHLDVARMSEHFNFPFLRPMIDYVTKTVFNWADYTLAPSRLVQQEMLALGIHEVGLWKRGVDSERFHPRYFSHDMRSRLSQGHPDDAILLYVGRLSEEKQVDRLRAVLERVPNTRLALVGDGPSRSALEEHFAGTNTHFVGYLHGEELSQAYASADVFVFPSALETFGLVVVEAMAAGIPVVASRVGGIPDVLQEGETGYLFNVGDVEALVRGVELTLANPSKRRQMGEAARTFAEAQSWPAMMEEVIHIYQRLMDEANSELQQVAS